MQSSSHHGANMFSQPRRQALYQILQTGTYKVSGSWRTLVEITLPRRRRCLLGEEPRMVEGREHGISHAFGVALARIA